MIPLALGSVSVQLDLLEHFQLSKRQFNVVRQHFLDKLMLTDELRLLTDEKHTNSMWHFRKCITHKIYKFKMLK